MPISPNCCTVIFLCTQRLVSCGLFLPPEESRVCDPHCFFLAINANSRNLAYYVYVIVSCKGTCFCFLFKREGLKTFLGLRGGFFKMTCFVRIPCDPSHTLSPDVSMCCGLLRFRFIACPLNHINRDE